MSALGAPRAKEMVSGIGRSTLATARRHRSRGAAYTRRRMRRSTALVAVIAFCAAFAALAGAAASAAEPAQIGMLVRFHELPGGYVIGDEGVGCGYLDPEGTEPPLLEFLARRLPRVCEATYERRF